MARRRTLGKQYYKNRQKNYNISKIKRVKRIKTKTRKLGRGRGFPNIFGRTRVVPLSFHGAQQETLRNHMIHIDEHIEILKKTVSEIEELYKNHKQFFSTIENFNKDYTRFIEDYIKPKLYVSPDTYRDAHTNLGKKNSYVRTFKEFWQRADYLQGTILAHARRRLRKVVREGREDIVFSEAEEEALSEITRLLNIIKDNSEPVEPGWDVLAVMRDPLTRHLLL